MATLKLDLGAGQRPTEGFKSVDLVGDPDYEVDLFQYPWPFKDRSVDEVVSNHLIEHIPHYRPEYGGVDGFWMFFNELHRILKKNATVKLTCPFFKNDRAFFDPSHTRYIHWMNFAYFDQEWLDANGLQHYPITARFSNIVTAQVPDDVLSWNAERQEYAKNHFWNAVIDLEITLTALK
jgi:predicted SAM-dependent methyltransferase